MKYNIKHTCGHEQTHDIEGSSQQRTRKVEWFAGTLCTECWKADVQKRMSEVELPELTGSEKQINWAQTLRFKIYDKLMRRASEAPEAARERLSSIVLQVMSKYTSAKHWIDCRAEGAEFYIGELNQLIVQDEVLCKLSAPSVSEPNNHSALDD